MLRRATSEDADAIAAVFIPSYGSLTFLPALHTDDATRAWIRDVVLPSLEVWVAEADGKVVGFAALSDDLLEHLYVHPREQNRGVGTELLDHAKKRRPEGFRLWVFQKNEGARRFYERRGFALVTLTDGAENMEREPDARYEWTPLRLRLGAR